jgi:nucleoside-diphosphate-sugar epimerase
MAESYYNSFGLPVVIARPFNTYGPRQSSRAFIPTVISQALSLKKIVMGSLEPVRDMSFVKDTVEGLIKVGLCDQVVGQTVNLGTGQGETIGTMVDMILRLLDKESISVEQDPARIRPGKSEVMRLISDNTKAREICGWTPQYDLTEGLLETIEWIRKNLHRYRPARYTI